MALFTIGGDYAGSTYATDNDRVFTAVEVTAEGDVYVATADAPRLTEMQTGLVRVDPRGELSSLRVPDELGQRRILYLLWSSHTLFVVSQVASGGADDPRVDAYNTQDRTWKFLGSTSCSSNFTALQMITISTHTVEFYCDRIGTFNIEGHALPARGRQQLPVTHAGAAPLTASLQLPTANGFRALVVKRGTIVTRLTASTVSP
jgi:hypothetical protein